MVVKNMILIKENDKIKYTAPLLGQNDNLQEPNLIVLLNIACA